VRRLHMTAFAGSSRAAMPHNRRDGCVRGAVRLDGPDGSRNRGEFRPMAMNRRQKPKRFASDGRDRGPNGSRRLCTANHGTMADARTMGDALDRRGSRRSTGRRTRERPRRIEPDNMRPDAQTAASAARKAEGAGARQRGCKAEGGHGSRRAKRARRGEPATLARGR
jgi:hypothetical protein